MVHARDVARLTRHIIQVRMTSTGLSFTLVLALVGKGRTWVKKLDGVKSCNTYVFDGVGVVVFPSGVGFLSIWSFGLASRKYAEPN